MEGRRAPKQKKTHTSEFSASRNPAFFAGDAAGLGFRRPTSGPTGVRIGGGGEFGVVQALVTVSVPLLGEFPT